jgi:tetratricopeptide (TPR) repeat protein
VTILRRFCSIITIGITLLISRGIKAQEVRQPIPPAGASTAQQTEIDQLARIAQEAHEKGDWGSAIQACQRLIQLAPNSAEYQLNLGIAFYSSRHFPEAVAPLRQALKIKPALSPARYYLAVSLAGSGHCQEALSYLKKDLTAGIEKRLKYEMGLAGVRCSTSLNRSDDAVDFVRKLRREFPADAEVLYQSVHVYSDLSMRASEELLQKAPGSYQSRLLSAESLEMQNKWEEAAKEYRKVLEQHPNEPGIHFRLGRLIISAPKTATTAQDAQREFEAELEIDPSNAGAEFVLGQLSLQPDKLEAAIEHFSRAGKIDANFLEAHLELGQALIQAGRIAEAVKPLEAAVKIQPDNPLCHFRLSTAYNRLGRKEEAQKEIAIYQQLSEKQRQATEKIQKAVSGVPE